MDDVPEVGTPTRRCYECSARPALYEAGLDWSATPVVFLCGGCAAWERRFDSVRWIRSLRRAR